MTRITYFTYGVLCHVMFLLVYAYFAGFVTNQLVPKSIDSPAAGPIQTAIAVDLLLILLFGVQHSVMARPTFKRWWTRFIPTPIERSTYVLISNILVILMVWLWIPIPAPVWDVQIPALRWGIWTLCAAGWVLVPAASLLINHFDLFGTRQVWLHLKGQAYSHLPFRTPLLYRFVRHPLYVGWIMAFWATPTMTLGHLIFAIAMTGYILIALRFEERNLVEAFGQLYVEYQRQVPGFIPRVKPHELPSPAGTTAPQTADIRL
jgi:protein-S-isoprenylcysteine O-methyltransferase Ste14